MASSEVATVAAEHEALAESERVKRSGATKGGADTARARLEDVEKVVRFPAKDKLVLSATGADGVYEALMATARHLDRSLEQCKD